MLDLGDEVKDVVSGFQGVAVSKHIYLHGCCRITVQPKVTKDKKLPESQTFDDMQLVLIRKKKVGKGSPKTGGPSKYDDTNRDSVYR